MVRVHCIVHLTKNCIRKANDCSSMERVSRTTKAVVPHTYGHSSVTDTQLLCTPGMYPPANNRRQCGDASSSDKTKIRSPRPGLPPEV